MGERLIVVSAVNLVEGGTLTILRDCLQYLSTVVNTGEYRVVALVYKRELADFAGIEYIECQWPKRMWINRLWFEYVKLNYISKEIGEVYLWLSLHDTTPNVKAIKRAVYCHNPFPFYKWNWREWFLTPKIVMFSLFSKYAYKINIKKNDYVIVQQKWIRDRFVEMFDLENNKIIIAIPDIPIKSNLPIRNVKNDRCRFIYAASPNSHKNFECLAEASRILSLSHPDSFEVLITVKGDENAYAKWLKKKYGDISEIRFSGFKSQSELFQHYANAEALIFPSKVETWGLPISEFAQFDKPMLLADLPYAHETAAGYKRTAFFDPNNPEELANKMLALLNNDDNFLKEIPNVNIESPVVKDWKHLFFNLLS